MAAPPVHRKTAAKPPKVELDGVKKKPAVLAETVELAHAPLEHGTGFDLGVPVMDKPPAPGDIAQLALMATNNPRLLDMLVGPVRNEVEAVLKLGVGQTNANKFEAVFTSMEARLGKESALNALRGLAEVTNAGSRALVPEGDRAPWDAIAGKPDSYDWRRTWGYTLLSRDNPRFMKGDYLIGWNQEAGQNAAHFQGRTSPSQAKRRFEALLKEFVPHLGEVVYELSGSSANNLCFDIARRCALERNKSVDWNKPKPEPKRATMAFFEGVYGGGRGESVSMSFEHFNSNAMLDVERYKIPSPTTKSLVVTDRAELARLEPIEQAALDKLRALANDEEHPIGAIFIEPIQSAGGVLCYRTEFITKLRALADELKLPIIADEVYNSGGRTGKFFAYEHYQGFEPDYVTFGKGLGVNGVAMINREQVYAVGADGEKHYTYRPASQTQRLGVWTTGEGSPGDFHKSAEILTAVKEDKLLERATVVGNRIEQRLRAAQAAAGKEVEATAFGCLIGFQPVSYGGPSTLDGRERRRLSPPIDISDQVLEMALDDMTGKKS